MKPQKCSKHVRDLIFLHTNLMPNVFWYILKLNHSCSSYPTRASDSGQVDWFRNPMKNDLKTTACLEIISNTDANFLNLHIGKATKTLGDKQLYLITHFTKQTLNQNYLPLSMNVTAQLLNYPSLNSRSVVATSCFWFTFNLVLHFRPKMALTLEILSGLMHTLPRNNHTLFFFFATSRRSKGPVIWSQVPETTLPLRQLYRAFICENVVPVGRVKVNPA